MAPLNQWKVSSNSSIKWKEEKVSLLETKQVWLFMITASNPRELPHTSCRHTKHRRTQTHTNQDTNIFFCLGNTRWTKSLKATGCSISSCVFIHTFSVFYIQQGLSCFSTKQGWGQRSGGRKFTVEKSKGKLKCGDKENGCWQPQTIANMDFWNWVVQRCKVHIFFFCKQKLEIDRGHSCVVTEQKRRRKFRFFVSLATNKSDTK